MPEGDAALIVCTKAWPDSIDKRYVCAMTSRTNDRLARTISVPKGIPPCRQSKNNAGNDVQRAVAEGGNKDEFVEVQEGASA